MFEYHYSRRVEVGELNTALANAFGEVYGGCRVNDLGLTVFLTEERPAIDVNAIVEAQDIAILSSDKVTVAAGDDVTVTVWLPYTDQVDVRIQVEDSILAKQTLDDSKRSSWVINAGASLDGSLTIGVPDHPHEALEIGIENDIT